MHDVESRSARAILASVGLAASLMLLCCSGYMNFRYGYTLGRTSQDGYIYGSAAAAADLLMAASPFFFFAAIRNREVARSLAAVLVWVVTTAFAAQSAIGHAAANRFDVASARTVSSTSYQDVRDDLKDARQKIGFIPDARPELAVRAEIEKHKVNRFWTGSNECTEISGKAQREYCATYQALNAELGNSMERAKQQTRIDALVAKSDQAGTVNIAVASEADPQAKVISIMSGFDLKTVQGMLTLMVVLMILLCAGLGPYASMSMLVPPRRTTRAGALTVEGELVPNPPAEPKLALPAPRALTALLTGSKLEPKPVFPHRPEPQSDAKRLLEAIDFAPSFYRGPERDKDSRDHVAWRFLAWVTAHGLGGEHNNEKMDALLEEFAAADHRPAWASRVVKAELQALGKGFATAKQASVPRADGGRDRATHWVIVPPTIPKLLALLEKNKVIAGPKQPPAKEAGPSTVVPFSGAAGVAPDAIPAADKASQMDISSKAWLKRVASLANGLDWSAHNDPSLTRAEKASWRERLIGQHRKQKNRMARNRSAA